MKKITVVGGGNAGCFTALYCAWMDKQKDFEVELIYDPEIPPERVGQATILEASALLWATTGFNWYDNEIHATMKSGILYEGWGQKNDNIFHHFPADRMAMHYCPWEMQRSILESGHFKVTEGEINSSSDVRIIRDGAIIYTGKVSTIFREKNQVKQVSGGQECGITVKDYMDFQKNDTIEAFSVTSTERSI